MKNFFTKTMAVALLASVVVGCGPKPVVEKPATEPPASDAQQPKSDDAKVKVQVGGGEGVQVETTKPAQATAPPTNPDADANK